MAERKKKRVYRKKRENVIDATVNKVSNMYNKGKAEVTGSKSLRSGMETSKRAVDTATAMSKKLGTRAKEAVMPKAKQVAEQATAAKNAATQKAKTLRGGGAAAANERIKARQVGPQQGTPYRQQKPAAGFAGNVQPNDRTRADAQKAFEQKQAKAAEKQAKAAEKPKRGMVNRGLRYTGNKAGRVGLKYGGPAAAAAGLEGLMRFGVDVADRGLDTAIGDRAISAGDALADLPENTAQFGRDLVNKPVRTGLGLGAGILDTAANVGLTTGDMLKSGYDAITGDESFADRFNYHQGQTKSLRDPFGRMLNAMSPEEEQKQLPANQPVGPRADEVAAGAPGQGETATKTRGLGAAMSNREFLANEGNQFRSGFDVLKDSGYEKRGGIGDLAAYNAATGIARRDNARQIKGREMNIAEAEARAGIEGQGITNALNLSKIDKNRAATDANFRKELTAAGEGARGILEKYNEFKEQQRSAWGDDDQALANIEAYENNVINQAMGAAWDPLSPDSQAATQILSNNMEENMDMGMFSKTYEAITSDGWDAGDILDDSGNVALNRENLDRMIVVNDEDGPVVRMDVFKEGKDGKVLEDNVPLFRLDDLEPKFRDQLFMVLDNSSSTKRRTLNDAQR